MGNDFEDLSAIWREGIDSQEINALGVLSDRAIARAKLEEKVELAMAFAIGFGIIFGIWRSGAAQSAVFGTLIIGTLIWSSRSRYNLRRVEWRRNDESRESFIQDAIAATAARVRRATFSLVLLVPATTLGLMFGRGGASLASYQDIGQSTSIFTLVLAALGLLALAIYLVANIVRGRRQLMRLGVMFMEYQAESRNLRT